MLNKVAEYLSERGYYTGRTNEEVLNELKGLLK